LGLLLQIFRFHQKKIVGLQEKKLAYIKVLANKVTFCAIIGSAVLARFLFGNHGANFAFQVGPLSKVKSACVQKVCTTPRAADKSVDSALKRRLLTSAFPVSTVGSRALAANACR
jgi:hypothetical protein